MAGVAVKKALRKDMKAVLGGLGKEAREEQSRRLVDRLTARKEYKEAR